MESVMKNALDLPLLMSLHQILLFVLECNIMWCTYASELMCVLELIEFMYF